MFADAGVKLPKGVGTRSPEDVAKAVVAAIEHNRGEVDVAPIALRLGSAFAGFAPEMSATFTRKSGSDKIAYELADGHKAKATSCSFGSSPRGEHKKASYKVLRPCLGARSDRLRDRSQDGWRNPLPPIGGSRMKSRGIIRVGLVVGALATGGAVAGIAGAAAAPSSTTSTTTQSTSNTATTPSTTTPSSTTQHRQRRHRRRRQRRRDPAVTRARTWAASPALSGSSSSSGSNSGSAYEGGPPAGATTQ